MEDYGRTWSRCPRHAVSDGCTSRGYCSPWYRGTSKRAAGAVLPRPINKFPRRSREEYGNDAVILTGRYGIHLRVLYGNFWWLSYHINPKLSVRPSVRNP